MDKKIKEEKNYMPELVRKEDIPLVFVEGLSQLQLGFPNTKLVFHNRVEAIHGQNDELIEKRYISHEIVMPTTALFDLLAHSINIIEQNKDDLEGKKNGWIEYINKKFENLGSK